MSDERFDRAAAGFAAAHAQDPRPAADGGTQSERYHEAVAGWVDRLNAGAPEAVRLAARAQHIRRWTVPRSDFPDGGVGYKKWRSQLALFHGEQASEIMAAAGYDDAACARVRDLLLKKKLTSDAEVQLLEDAVCLTFLQREFAEFAEKHPDDKVVDIVRKTWAKMSEHGHAAAAGLLPDMAVGPRELVERALAGDTQ